MRYYLTLVMHVQFQSGPCCWYLQDEVLARSQSKQFYQHLLSNFQQLKKDLTSSRPCFLLPRGGGANSNTSPLAVTCAMDDDLATADEARQHHLLSGEALIRPYPH